MSSYESFMSEHQDRLSAWNQEYEGFWNYRLIENDHPWTLSDIEKNDLEQNNKTIVMLIN